MSTQHAPRGRPVLSLRPDGHRVAHRKARRRRSAHLLRRCCCEELESRLLLSTDGFVGVPEWVQAGWEPELGNSNTILPDQNSPVAGGINRVLAIPSRPNALYIASNSGGIWESPNTQTVGADGFTPNWVELTDEFPSLSMGDNALEQL